MVLNVGETRYFGMVRTHSECQAKWVPQQRMG